MAEDLPRPEPEAEFASPDSHSLGTILFSPDSKHLVGLGFDRLTRQGILDFWSLDTRKLVRTLRQPGKFPAGFTAVPDGTPRQPGKLPGGFSAVVFTPDGKRLVTAGWDRKLYVFAAPDWTVEHVFDHDPPTHVAQRLAMFPDGQRFLSGNSSLKILGPRIWDLNRREAKRLPGPQHQLNALTVSKDGKRFAVAYSGPVTEVWDAAKLQVVGRLEVPSVFVSVSFSPDGKWIATGSGVGDGLLVRIWDARTFKCIHKCRGASSFPESIGFSADSKLVVCTTGMDWDIPGKVCLWDVGSGKLAHAFSPSIHGCQVQALSSDGRWFATNGVDRIIRLWDFAKIRRNIRE